MTMKDISAETSEERTSVAGASPARASAAHRCKVCDIRHKAFCGVLNEAALMRLAAISTECRFKAPQSIVYEGDPAEYVFNVCHGVVRLTKMLADGRRQITGFLFPGDFIGLSYTDEYSFCVEAVTEVELCRFPRQGLMQLTRDTPNIERKLLDMAADDLSSAQDQILLLGRKTARERVASFLLMLSRKAERRGDKANPVDLPMSRADIADYLGLTIETVSRTLTRLVKEGLIDLSTAHTARILNRDLLEGAQSGTE